jgi:arginine dihydrolase ArgZ-like protein
MTFGYDDFDLSGIKTYPLRSRKSKARVEDFARPSAPGASIGAWLDSLPNALAAADFKAVVRAVQDARQSESGVVWGLGAHVVKTGLGPVLIDLMERGYVSAIAANGATIIHDFEIALVGATSEDVDESLGPGRFGMAEETGRLLNAAISDGVAAGLGIGQSITGFFAGREAQFARHSVLAAAARLKIPVTVHVAIGTDITHMHPAASGAALGDGSLRDFRYFVSNVARLERGVFLNCGSAVVLPEVFLKAVALARNAGVALAGLTTVNLDFIRSYRAQTNVVARPTAGTGRGYSLVGHHEIMIPLLAAALTTAGP